MSQDADVNPWANVARLAPVQGNLVSLVEGSTLAISDASGDIAPPGAQGLFHRDTRFLSCLRLLVNGKPLESLAARPVDAYSARFVLRVPWSGPGESPLTAVRSRFVGDGLHEDLAITNHGDEPAELVVELQVDTDFADLFEVKLGSVAARECEVTRRASCDDGLMEIAHVEGGRRSVAIRVSARPEELTGTTARFRVALAPGSTWNNCLDVYVTADGEQSRPKCGCDGFGARRAVDAIASNAGHLLWSGILSREQEAAVAQRLVRPDLFSGWGLRTLAATNRGYRPVSYHVGGVWPHDTAIAVAGLARAGFHAEAATLTAGLVEAGEHFAHRLPELFSGFDRHAAGFPVPYPTAASPQAWSAASPLLLLRVLLGLEPAPGGDLRVRPILPPDALPLRLEGIATAAGRRSVLVGLDGEAVVVAG